MPEVRVTGTADEIELIARSLGAAPRIQRRRDGMMAGYFEVQAPKIICLDLGTTGPDPVEDEIAAIAIVDWAGNVVHEGKYRPSRKELWQAASEVNGVSPDDQIDLPSFFDDQAKIRDIVCGADEVIVYNAPRVMRFLEYNDAAPSSGTRVTDAMYEYCHRLGIASHDPNCLAHIELVDTAVRIGYASENSPHGTVTNALACLAVQKWIEGRQRKNTKISEYRA
jgi:DNA polymerase III epsilon subunit-like protein